MNSSLTQSLTARPEAQSIQDWKKRQTQNRMNQFNMNWMKLNEWKIKINFPNVRWELGIRYCSQKKSPNCETDSQVIGFMVCFGLLEEIKRFLDWWLPDLNSQAVGIPGWKAALPTFKSLNLQRTVQATELWTRHAAAGIYSPQIFVDLIGQSRANEWG